MRNTIGKINERELSKGLKDSSSWHEPFKNCPFVYVGGLPYDIREDDISTIFAQYGSVVNVDYVLDKETRKFKGFAFVEYKDPRSAILAVDNFNGIEVLGRIIKVDHAPKYEHKKDRHSREPDAS